MNCTKDQVTEIYYHLDEFCQSFEQEINKRLPQSNTSKYKTRIMKMSYSEVMSILVMFHLSGARCLKHFYVNYICKHLAKEFPTTFSYNRFVEVQSKV